MQRASLLLPAFFALSCSQGSKNSNDTGLDTGDSMKPDVCEGPLDPDEDIPRIVDCDQDGREDAVEIASGAVPDVNSDGIPDSCQLIEDTVWGREDYVSYQIGTLPIILLAPHGGKLEPDEIPQRSGASALPDLHTFELSQAISDAFYAELGRRPHLVACHLHRFRLDCNRSLEVGAEDNPFAQQAWHEFHDYISQAKANIHNIYGRGLLLDIHGMTRDKIEVGTLVTANQLLEVDERINHGAYPASSSVRSLEKSSTASFSSITRGSYSLGTLLSDHGYASIPSLDYPNPGLDSDGDVESYYHGGFNTLTHGSRSTGQIDAIQLEHPYSIREKASAREEYAEALVESVITFLETFSEVNLNATQGIRLETIDPILSELGNPGLIRLYRTGQIDEAISVEFQSGGQAVAGLDYSLPETIELNAGETYTDIEVSPVDDEEKEGPRSLSLRAKNTESVTFIGSPAELWIADNESPSVWIEGMDPDLGEGWESNLIVHRDFCDSAASTDILYLGESNAADFLEGRFSEVNFPANEASVVLSFRPKVDEGFEGLEDLQVVLGGQDLAASPDADWTGWIQDDELPVELQAWWSFENPTLPFLDRIGHTDAWYFPLDETPAIEPAESGSKTNWIQFDGIERILVIPEVPEKAESLHSIAFTFRANAEGRGDNYQYIWSQGDVGERSSLNIYLNSSGWIRTGFRAEEDDWNYRALDVEEDFRDGEWHKYSLLVDWNTPKAQVYIDGQLKAEFALGQGDFSPDGYLSIGGRSDYNPHRHFLGDVANIQIYTQD